MNQTQIEKANKDRFTKWIRHFNRENATVQVTLGVTVKGSNKGQLVLTSTEGPSNHQIKQLLQSAINAIETQEAQQN